jgi:tRNA(Arg) A34 adenosine deaminase TadA
MPIMFEGWEIIMEIDILYNRIIDQLQFNNNDNSYNQAYMLRAFVLDSHNRIISKGKNNYNKTHPMQSRLANKTDRPNRQYLHAEIAALVKARKEPFGILIIRITKTGLIKMARPCNICILAIREAGIKNVYYSGNDGLIHLDKLEY